MCREEEEANQTIHEQMQWVDTIEKGGERTNEEEWWKDEKKKKRKEEEEERKQAEKRREQKKTGKLSAMKRKMVSGRKAEKDCRRKNARGRNESQEREPREVDDLFKPKEEQKGRRETEEEFAKRMQRNGRKMKQRKEKKGRRKNERGRSTGKMMSWKNNTSAILQRNNKTDKRSSSA